MTAITPTRAEQLSINTATLGPRCDLRQAVEALQRQGIGAIAPWRDGIAAIGLAQAAQLIRGAGLTVTGLCRGGMFTADSGAGRLAAIDDNRRAIDEAAALGAACLVIVSGGLPTGTWPARAPWCATAWRRCSTTPALPACRSRSSPCIR
jgi:sugar phosphate isomerase/epimerase